MNQPNLFIVGAPKCGTTYLYSILKYNEHIDVCKIKEPNYYCRMEISWKAKVFSYLRIKFNKFNIHNEFILDKISYLKLFQDCNKKSKYFLDASTNYLLSKRAAKEIFTDNPNSKIIICYRDPTERLISHYKMGITNGKLGNKKFKYCMDISSCLKTYKLDNPFLLKQHSLYYASSQMYLKYFDKNQILFLDFNTIISKNRDLKSCLEKFLKLDNINLKFESHRNTSFQYENKFVYLLNSVSFIRFLISTFIPKNFIKKFKSRLNKKPITNIEFTKIGSKLQNELTNDFIKFKKLIQNR